MVLNRSFILAIFSVACQIEDEDGPHLVVVVPDLRRLCCFYCFAEENGGYIYSVTLSERNVKLLYEGSGRPQQHKICLYKFRRDYEQQSGAL